MARFFFFGERGVEGEVEGDKKRRLEWDELFIQFLEGETQVYL